MRYVALGSLLLLAGCIEVNTDAYPCTPIIKPQELPDGRVGQRYGQGVQADFGICEDDPVWFIESGNLPPGIELAQSPTAFRLFGTPTVAGEYPFVLGVRADGRSDKQPLSITIREAEGP